MGQSFARESTPEFVSLSSVVGMMLDELDGSFIGFDHRTIGGSGLFVGTGTTCIMDPAEEL